MNAPVTLSAQTHQPVDAGAKLGSIIEELNHYRQQSLLLSRTHKLHRKLATATDLQSMVDAFSHWLMPYVEHSLLAYDNTTHNKRCVLCSTVGPKKEKLTAIAQKALRQAAQKELAMNTSFYEEGLYVSVWEIGASNYASRILLVREASRVSDFYEQLIDEGINILEESLQRGLEYEYLYDQARSDSLTGLANRRVFDEHIDALLETAARYGRPITLASMDLDRFKSINDTMGHAKGDQVLQEVAALFLGLVRRGDLLIRMGGDEFLLLLPETDGKSAVVLAKRLCNAVAALDIATPCGQQLGVSIGLAQWQAGQSKETWLSKADEALYRAKKNGRGCVGAP